MQKHTDGHLAGAPGHRLGACPGVSMASCAPRNTGRIGMKEFFTKFIRVFSLAAGARVAAPAWAADYPVPKEADWVARDFRFHTGENPLMNFVKNSFMTILQVFLGAHDAIKT